MRHASSFELVQKIKSFINEFVGVQSSGSAEASSQMVRRFVEVRKDVEVSLKVQTSTMNRP